MTHALLPATRRIAAILLAVAAALPATAANISIKNCSGETQVLEFRPGTGAQSDGVAVQVVEIYHRRTGSGSCGTGPSCWVKVRAGQANEVNALSLGEICLLIPQSSKPMTISLADCGCF
jgi:hypothetical protein